MPQIFISQFFLDNKKRKSGFCMIFDFGLLKKIVKKYVLHFR